MDSLLVLVSSVWRPVSSWEEVSTVAVLRQLFADIAGESSPINAEKSPGVRYSGFSDCRSFAGLIDSITRLYHGVLKVHTDALQPLKEVMHSELSQSTTKNERGVKMFLELWLIAAVQTDSKQRFGETILTFPETVQGSLMSIIQDGMAVLSAVPAWDEVPSPSHADGRKSTMSGHSSREVLAELQAARDELEWLRNENKELKARLESSEVSASALATASVVSPTVAEVSHSLRSNVRMLETQVEELNRVLSERDDAYLRLRNEYEDARRKYEETAKIQADELDVLRSKAADAKRLDALNVKLKAKMVSFNEMQDKIKALEAAVSSTQGKSAEVDAEKAAVASLRAQLTELRSKLNEVEHALSQSNTSCAAKEAEVARLQRERTDWMTQRAALESQLVEATHAAAVAHDVESNHDFAAASEATALKEQLEAANAALEAARAEVLQLREKAVQDQSEAHSTNAQELQAHYEKLQALETSLKEKDGKLHDAESHAVSSHRQLAEAQATLRVLQTEYQSAKEQLTALKTKAAVDADAVSSLRGELSAVRGASDKVGAQARAKLESLESLNADLKRDLAMKTAQAEELHKRVHDLQTSIDKATSASKEELLVTTALFEFGRDVQRNLLRGSLYAGSAYSAPSPADRWLGMGSTAAILAGGKTYLAQQREAAFSRGGL